MKQVGKKKLKWNLKNLNELLERHGKINKAIQEGRKVDPELTKNFISFPLSDNINYEEL